MRFDTSRALLTEAQRYLAGGVSTIMRADMRPVPLYFESGKGSRLVDVDHNEYIDYTLAFGPLILGHSHPAIVEAVKEQLLRGQAFGAQHRLEPAVAKQIHELVPCADLVVFSNTGTEAVQVALRVARAATGKNRFIKFEGHYHGWMDNVLVSYRGTADQLGSRESPRAVQTSRGQSPLAMEEPLVLPWNDLSAVESALGRNAGQIAAIITEPVMFNSGGIEPAPGYLRGLRDLCDRHGVVLIFDEVITGFRVALGGAQELYGVIPDLAVFGKALAAGFPLSAVAGRADLLDLIASRAVVHAGTFNGNPISLAAAHAALTELARSGASTFEAATRNAERLRDGIVSALSAVGIQASAHGVGPAFVISIGVREPLRDYRDLLDIDWATYGKFAEALLGGGILCLNRGLWYLSLVHSDEDIDLTLEASRRAVEFVGGSLAKV